MFHVGSSSRFGNILQNVKGGNFMPPGDRGLTVQWCKVNCITNWCRCLILFRQWERDAAKRNYTVYLEHTYLYVRQGPKDKISHIINNKLHFYCTFILNSRDGHACIFSKKNHHNVPRASTDFHSLSAKSNVYLFLKLVRSNCGKKRQR